MPEPLPIDAYQAPTATGQGPTAKGQGPTGPKTPEGKARCRLNANRHGLTGQICVLAPDEQQAYDTHSNAILEFLAPANHFERLLAQAIADDHWRLNRARAIENNLFAIGIDHGADNTSVQQVDDAVAQVRTWSQEARNLNLLTIYTQRIQRSVDKNMLQLKTLQTERKEQAQEAMRQAKLLYQLAQAEGKPYQPEAWFTAAPQVLESVFSTAEITRELSREELMNDAKYYVRSGCLREKDEPEQPAKPNAAPPRIVSAPARRSTATHS
jgi:hypothetical protein